MRAPVTRKLRAGAVASLLLAFAATGAAETVGVLRDGDVTAWEEKVFSGRTTYETVRKDGRDVVRATSDGTASGLYFRQRIDLEKTPILRWTWRVEGTLGDIDERTRAGDDYSARVYVIRSHPVLLWKTPGGELRLGQRETGGRYMAERLYRRFEKRRGPHRGHRRAGQWVDERRDVRADFRALFGKPVRYVDAVANHDRYRQHGRQRRRVLRGHRLHERVSPARAVPPVLVWKLS